GDGVALPQHALGARVQLHEVERVGAQPLEAALDGLEDGRRPPVVAAPAAGVADLGEEMELAAPAAHRAPDERLAVGVALGGVDHVQAGVERGVEQPGRGALAHALVADLAAAEAERRDLHVGASEPPPLHQSSHHALARQLCWPWPAARQAGSGITRWSASAITYGSYIFRSSASLSAAASESSSTTAPAASATRSRRSSVRGRRSRAAGCGRRRRTCARSTTAWRAMANVSSACRAQAPCTPTITRALVSRMVVSAASQDWLSCCERKYDSTGKETWLSRSSADQRSQSRSNSRRSSPPSRKCRRSSCAAVGGEPARASSIEMLTSRREKACEMS